MNITEIEALLEKYYNGETTLEEEVILRDFFRVGIVPAHLEEHAKLFRYYNAAAKEILPDPGFDGKLDERLKEASQHPFIPAFRPRNRLYSLLAMAATVLLLAGLFFTIYQSGDKTPDVRVENPELAYEQASQALLMVSGNLNFGLEKTQTLSRFGKGMEQIGKLSKFSEYQPLIINQDTR